MKTSDPLDFVGVRRAENGVGLAPVSGVAAAPNVSLPGGGFWAAEDDWDLDAESGLLR
jgi:hypothetical protein